MGRGGWFGALTIGLAVALGGCAAGRPRPAGAGALVVVGNEGSGDLTVIDAARDAPLARIPVGRAPRALRASVDGRIVYVEVGEADGVIAAAAGEGNGTGIAVVDLAARRRVALLPTVGNAGFDLLPGGRALVVPHGDGHGAVLLPAEGEARRGRRPVDAGAVAVGASPDGRTIAVVSRATGRLVLLDAWTRKTLAEVATGHGPRAIAFSPDGRLAFVPCEEGDVVTVVDVGARDRLVDVALREGLRPVSAAMSPDGLRVYVSTGGGAVAVIDAIGLRLDRLVTVGGNLGGLAVTPDGRKLYVADEASNEVAVLDTGTLAVVRRVLVGERPVAVAVAR